jgi:DNA adenine methylase
VKPIIKWQGGKTQLLEELNKLKPKNFNSYFEPFLGGAAFLISLQPPVACINDWNSELINLYRVLSDTEKYKMLLRRLDGMQEKIDKRTTKAEKTPYYEKIRSMDKKPNFKSIKDYNRAARFIFLNKLCFNGRYRENSKGEFNVSLGDYKKVNLYDKETMESLQQYFQNNIVDFHTGDYSSILKKAKKGDLVYMDPPYDPIVDTESSYTSVGFSKEDQIKLANDIHELTKKGVKVMISNHNTELITSLFKGYEIYVVMARRSISCNPNTRGPVEEVIIRNYDDNDEIIKI